MQPDIRSRAPAPIPVQRHVYSYVEHPSGLRVYVAITSTGALLNGELRRRLPDETHASIIRDMWMDLDRQDPVSDPRPLGLWVDGERRR
jgi:hypothetical protein